MLHLFHTRHCLTEYLEIRFVEKQHKKTNQLPLEINMSFDKNGLFKNVTQVFLLNVFYCNDKGTFSLGVMDMKYYSTRHVNLKRVL